MPDQREAKKSLRPRVITTEEWLEREIARAPVLTARQIAMLRRAKRDLLDFISER